MRLRSGGRFDQVQQQACSGRPQAIAEDEKQPAATHVGQASRPNFHVRILFLHFPVDRLLSGDHRRMSRATSTHRARCERRAQTRRINRMRFFSSTIVFVRPASAQRCRKPHVRTKYANGEMGSGSSGSMCACAKERRVRCGRSAALSRSRTRARLGAARFW